MSKHRHRSIFYNSTDHVTTWEMQMDNPTGYTDQVITLRKLHRGYRLTRNIRASVKHVYWCINLDRFLDFKREGKASFTAFSLKVSVSFAFSARRPFDSAIHMLYFCPLLVPLALGALQFVLGLKIVEHLSLTD